MHLILANPWAEFQQTVLEACAKLNMAGRANGISYQLLKNSQTCHSPRIEFSWGFLLGVRSTYVSRGSKHMEVMIVLKTLLFCSYLCGNLSASSGSVWWSLWSTLLQGVCQCASLPRSGCLYGKRKVGWYQHSLFIWPRRKGTQYSGCIVLYTLLAWILLRLLELLLNVTKIVRTFLFPTTIALADPLLIFVPFHPICYQL